VQHGFDHGTITTIVLIYNAGAIVGGIGFGMLSQRIGRRVTIVIAALLSLAVLPLWAFGETALTIGVGAFLMQVCVQGAWGVIPAHLNELSPPSIRATFPGVVYQLGNLLASYNATLQSGIGARTDPPNYSWALAGVAGAVAIVIALLVGFGVEARDVKMGEDAAPETAKA
jgi:MFS transporter, SHS family, lactate transporter